MEYSIRVGFTLFLGIFFTALYANLDLMAEMGDSSFYIMLMGVGMLSLSAHYLLKGIKNAVKEAIREK